MDKLQAQTQALQWQMRAIRDLLFKAEKQLGELGVVCFDIQENDSCTESEWYLTEKVRDYIDDVEDHLGLAASVNDNLKATKE